MTHETTATAKAVMPSTSLAALDQVNEHARSNNELLTTCLSDLRSFLNRAVGESPPGAPQPEAAALQAGAVGNINDALHEQTRILGDVRECITAIEKLA